MLEFRSSKNRFDLEATVDIFQGSPQWIQITPNASNALTSIAVKFQGGFAARRFLLEERHDDGSFASLAEFFPDDHGKLQISFSLVLLFVEEFFFRIEKEIFLNEAFSHLSSSNGVSNRRTALPIDFSREFRYVRPNHRLRVEILSE